MSVTFKELTLDSFNAMLVIIAFTGTVTFAAAYVSLAASTRVVLLLGLFTFFFGFSASFALSPLIQGEQWWASAVSNAGQLNPSAPLFIAELPTQAGVPAGIFNVVNGDKEAVDALLTNPDVKAVSFVGSTPIARYIYATGTAHGKRVQALGGAKNHMIVMPDADIDKAADALMGAGYGSAGERCMAVSVAVPVGEETADRLVGALAPRVRRLKVGPSTDQEAEMGPLVTAEHMRKVVGYIEKGVAEGAELVVDGRGFRLQGYEKGYFVGGTLFDRVRPDMTIYREEIFGPVLSVVPVDDYQGAVTAINQTRYGLSSSIFTRDANTAFRAMRDFETGIVYVNAGTTGAETHLPFGGWKETGNGHREAGHVALDTYTEWKSIYVDFSGRLQRAQIDNQPS